MRIAILILVLIAGALSANAQKERKFIREGNGLFGNQDFEKAEVEYRKALDKKAESFEAVFNLGDALYKQKKYDEALQQFSSLIKGETDKGRLGELYHNIGNTLLSMEKTDESIEAYKESLRNRPASEETKYNLEFARRKKQQDQQKQDQKDQNKDNKDQNKDQQDQQNKDQQDKDNKDQKDQNKDNKDQNKDQNKDNKDQQDKDNKDQKDQNKDNKDQNKDQQDQQQQPQEGKISKEDAQRLLEALQGDEKKTQEKVQQQKVKEQKAKKMKIEKDW